MVEINKTGINPAQTDSSNTAAKGESSLNIIIVNTRLTSARPIAERSKLRVITVHKAAIVKNMSINIFNVIIKKFKSKTILMF